jgi:hypothetical protein
MTMTYFDMSQLSRGAEAIGRMVQEHDERVAALEHAVAAALARAEAAEAEAQALRGLAVAIQGRLDFELERRQAAEARVAELEAALAAQGWRPVTITEPSLNVMAELIIVGYRGHDGYWYYPDDPDGLVIRGWRPVPPSVALREPTP